MIRKRFVVAPLVLGIVGSASAVSAQSTSDCNAPPYIPVRGAIGPDGAWHEAPAPAAPPTATGGGPCVARPRPAPSVAVSSSAAPADEHASATEASARPSAEIAPNPYENAPNPYAAAAPAPSIVRANPYDDAPNPYTSAPHVETAATTVTPPAARGGGPDLPPAPLEPNPYLAPEPVAPPPPETVAVVRPVTGTTPHRFARLVLGASPGVAGFTSGTRWSDLGPSWNVEAGVELGRVFSLVARYDGSYNASPSGASTGPGLGLLASGGALLGRVAVPMRWLRPFAHAGIGWYEFTTHGPEADTLSANAGLATRVVQVPVGGGLELRFAPCWSLGFEYTYHLLFDTTLHRDGGSAHPWGDLWTASAGVRFYL